MHPTTLRLPALRSGRTRTTIASVLAMFLLLAGFAASARSSGLVSDSAASILPVSYTTPTDDGDSNAVEVGLVFKANQSGFVTGIRFYKVAANTGTHTGTLWSADGTRLATATFSNESAKGWQSVSFEPVPVQAGSQYVVSYFAPDGGYAISIDAFSSGRTLDLGPMTGTRGVYVYGGDSPRSRGRTPAITFSRNGARAQPPVAARRRRPAPPRRLPRRRLPPQRRHRQRRQRPPLRTPSRHRRRGQQRHPLRRSRQPWRLHLLPLSQPQRRPAGSTLG